MAEAIGDRVPGTEEGDLLQGRIQKAFSLMKTAFTPERAAGWNAVIHFLIPGASNYTITVKDQKVQVEQGTKGTPTCQVAVSAETMARMIEGKTSGKVAFLSGKIKATNLGDMMKFGKVFDFKRAREAAPVPDVSLDRIFARLPSAFLAQSSAGAGLNGKVIFDAPESSGWTLKVENGACQVVSGKEPGAICAISGSSRDLAEVLSGRIDFGTAMSQGRIKVSNPMGLVRFKNAFDWKRAA